MPSVKLFASLRKLTGKKEVSVPGASIQEVLEKLSRDFPNLQQYLLEERRLHARVIITINGQTLDLATSLQAPVSEQDQIAIFPPIAGG